MFFVDKCQLAATARSTGRAACARASVLLLILPLVAGCGSSKDPPKYPVKGKISFQGQPVGEGTMQFFSPTVGSSGVKIAATGEFDFKEVGGLTEGSYQVFVAPPEQFTTPPQAGGPPMTPKKEFPNIPPKYRQAATSGFTAVVKSGDNKFEFDMVP